MVRLGPRISTDEPSLAEQAAQLWHELHASDVSHHYGGGGRGCWCCCRACRAVNPYHLKARRAALADIRARIIESDMVRPEFRKDNQTRRH